MTNSSPSESYAPHVSPVESHVAYLVALALGIIIGRTSASTEPLDFPLPAAISTAGGKLDTLAGDALLSADDLRWYLMEFKRTPGELSTELKKARVQRLKAIVESPTPPEAALIENARIAHRFIYLGEDDEDARRLFQRSYISWLKGDNGGERAPFVEFVCTSLLSGSEEGFTFSQLVNYVGLMNQEGETSGEDATELLALAIEAGGQAHIYTESEFLKLKMRPRVKLA